MSKYTSKCKTLSFFKLLFYILTPVTRIKGIISSCVFREKNDSKE